MIDWLLGTLVATSALMALVLAVREPVRSRFGPSSAYALWLIPAARMVMPSLTQTVYRVLPAQSAGTIPLEFDAGPAALALSNSSDWLATVGGWPAVIVALWLGGATVMLARGYATYFHQRRAILGDGVQLATIGDIRLVRSERVSGPVAFGIFDRVVIVPLGFEERFSESQRRLSLDHELAHHRSGDLVANSIAFVLLCLQWFNPLAWASHSAFRFDQEAACDARVLDKSDGQDRASYGEAIAKAASGRTVLFAGALDRPSTLYRRLKIMSLDTPRKDRRRGAALIGGAVLVALPLTATKAVDYVDVPATVTAAARTATPAAASVTAKQAATASPVALPPVALASVAPVALSSAAPVSSGVTVGINDISFITNDRVRINGATKRWSELSPAERARIREETARARQQLNEQMAKLPQELAQAHRESEKFRTGEYKRETASAREDMRRAIAEIDNDAADLRASGQNPDQLKADIRQAMRTIEQTDVDRIVRDSLASVNPDKIRDEVTNAAKSLDDIDAKLDQLDAR